MGPDQGLLDLLLFVRTRTEEKGEGGLNQPLHAGQQKLSDCVDMAIAGKADPLVVKRIEREAWALLDKGASQPEISWLILGFTAFFQGKAADCVRYIEAAAKITPYDLTVLGNAGSVLAAAGEPRRAATYARRQAGMSEGDGAQLLYSGFTLRKALFFEEAAQIMRTHSGSADSENFRAANQRLADAANTRGISPDLRLSLLETAIEAVRAQGSAIKHVGISQYPDDTLRYVFYIDQTASQCASVNFLIAEALIEKFEDAHPEFVTFACRPTSSYDVQGTFIEVAR